MEIAKTIAPFCLIIIMFGLGLGLTVADFKRLTKYPGDFIVGFFGQVILLPIVAFILIHIISLPPELALGTMLIAAAPGGVMSNILTKFANGDVALSVSLTAIISLISVITVPFIIFNSAGFLNIEIGKEISMLNIALKMFVAVTVPVALGMIVRALMSDFVISKTLLVQRLSLILFLIVFAAIWIEEWDKITSFIQRAGLIALVLNLTMIFLGYYLAKFLASGVAQRKCISLECGLQNGTLALVVANVFFDGGVYLIPAATYSLIMYATALPYIYYLRRN